MEVIHITAEGAKRLRALLRERKMTRAQLCKKLGILPQRLTDYLQGKRVPPAPDEGLGNFLRRVERAIENAPGDLEGVLGLKASIVASPEEAVICKHCGASFV